MDEPRETSPATTEEVAVGTEISVEATAITLQTLSEAIEALGESSRERAAELMREVQECQTRLRELSTSGPTESPLLQQMAGQLNAIHSTVETIQREVTIEDEELEANPEDISTEMPESPSATSTNENSGRGSKRTSSESGNSGNGGRNENSTPPASNPSPTPSPIPPKKRYVKV